MMSRPDDLEDLVAAHEAIVGEVDHAHAAAAQLADDLVVGMVGQLGGQQVFPTVVGRGGSVAAAA